jgi:hypothetical protein
VLTATAGFIAAIAPGQRRDLKHTVEVEWLPDLLGGDGDFEDKTLGAWTLGGSATACVAPVTEPGQPGSWSAQVEWPTGGFFPQFDRVLTGLTVGQQYRTRSRGYVPTGSPPVVWDVTDGATTTNGFPSGPLDAWGNVDHIWTATATSMTIRLNPTTGTTAGQRCWIDKVRVTLYPDTLRDMTRYVTAVTIDAAINTDLPETTRLVAGYSAAQATISCAGVDTLDTQWRTVSWLMSPANPAGPLYRTPKSGANVRVQLGVVTDTAGEELLPAFTGPVRLPTTNARERRVEIQALDPSSRLTKAVVLPPVAANDVYGYAPHRCGLNSQFPVDWILRQNGINSCPPPRPTCAYSATMHGSTWPEVGTITSSGFQRDDDNNGTPETQPEVPPFKQMMYGLGVCNGGQGALAQVSTTATLASTILTGNARIILFDAVVERSVQPVDGFTLQLSSATSAGKTNRLTVSANTGTAWKPKVVFDDGTTVTTLACATLTVPTGLSRLYVAVTYTADAVQSVEFRCDTTAETVTGAAPFPGDVVLRSMVSCQVIACNGVEAVQMCQGPAGPIPQLINFQSEATLEPGLNELSVMPLTTDAGWAVLQAVAKAEAAVCLFGPDGKFSFWNRQHWFYATAAATVQDTLTTASLKTVTIEESTDGTRNHVRIPTSPRVVQPAGVVWSADYKVKILPRQTVTVWAKFDTPVIGLSTSFTVIPSGGATTGSGYRASKSALGAGGLFQPITATITPFVDSARLDIRNPNGFTVWLVTPTGAGFPAGSVGLPALELWGSKVTDKALGVDTTTEAGASAYIADVITPEAAAGTTPEALYEADTTPWMQDPTSADMLAIDLLTALAAPPPIIRDVEVVGDPRRQLGDRVQLVDADGLALNDPGWLVGLRTTYDGSGGLTQQVTVRLVGRFGQWVLGVSHLGTETYL